MLLYFASFLNLGGELGVEFLIIFYSDGFGLVVELFSSSVVHRDRAVA